ncbi:DUF4291 domain-containing protein [Nonomuraea gerenzanensis]|uniref:DUF4291 domain-containing protein n=1 Tax=Nonomuraea gerenzanensis TaxID=93944 RepID=A0A1M4EHT7_9ACTN|nr:DUF4291 domain-containing protein [Nonomuraea gerenzanensis]UBU10094.1 DUF4291 domain-containing protein [Nonomuraea gerenzanensis]SBO98465.1 conserved hypothetical protein [Nonomuraea gerenzanensis]
MNVPHRQIRALHTERSITVYQAYDAAIAAPAVAAQRFVPPFKRERMTWIKPSFLWMMYRCGYATKPGQERVLAIELSHEGFAWALAHSCLSHDDRRPGWAERVRRSPVRIQWDPERGLRHQALPYRSIQVGLTGEAVRRYVAEWTLGISDITERVHEVRAAVRSGADAGALLPDERPYPLSGELAETIGASVA